MFWHVQSLLQYWSVIQYHHIFLEFKLDRQKFISCLKNLRNINSHVHAWNDSHKISELSERLSYTADRCFDIINATPIKFHKRLTILDGLQPGLCEVYIRLYFVKLVSNEVSFSIFLLKFGNFSLRNGEIANKAVNLTNDKRKVLISQNSIIWIQVDCSR